MEDARLRVGTGLKQPFCSDIGVVWAEVFTGNHVFFTKSTGFNHKFSSHPILEDVVVRQNWKPKIGWLRQHK
jgi:hypothetical protein